MNVLYLQCAMGASGDMLTAALASLLPDPAGFARDINSLGIPRVCASLERGSSRGMAGWRARIEIDGREEDAQPRSHGSAHGHSHARFDEILGFIRSLPVSDKVRANACSIYRRIAEAEAQAHGCAPGEVHFHEVGTADAVCDVVSVCLLMERLNPGRVVCSPVCVGSGLTYTAHGFLPVPAPATASLLHGVPSYGSDFPGELCTPTGAALISHISNAFGPMPEMTLLKEGCGLGSREFPQPNCLRALLGTAPGGDSETGSCDSVCELSANIDDMTAEDIALARDLLIDNGALDAWVIPLAMKKGRPGSMLCALCAPPEAARIRQVFFKHTSTLGVRSRILQRAVLDRSIETVSTALGPVRVKTARGWGTEKTKPEFDDIERLVRKSGLSAAEVRALVSRGKKG